MAQQKTTERLEPTFGAVMHRVRPVDAGEIHDIASLRYRIIKTIKVDGTEIYDVQYGRVIDATNPPPSWANLMTGLTTMESAIMQADGHYNGQVKFTRVFLLERPKV